LEADRFEWDDRKGRLNRTKHGVSFEEAITVIDDELAVELEDLDHSWEEARTILIGSSDSARVLLVVYLERDTLDEKYRIISARKATPRERSTY